MVVLHSAETRWIVRGRVPADLVAWFDGASPTTIEDRMDRYLVFPGCESVGLKVRNSGQQSKSRIEVKALRSSPEVVAYSQEMIGRADAWVKWTFPTDTIRDWVDAVIGEETTWATTRKRRRLRRFSLERPGDPREVEPGRHVPCGCSVELAEITVAGAGDWWTFGLESWGKAHDVRAHLRTTALKWRDVKGAPPLRFEAINSMAYPTWTAGLVATAESGSRDAD